MPDRGMIKWAPFDSLGNTQKIKHDIAKEKNVKKMPILSDDQILEIEQLIFSAYFNQDIINITYYKQKNFFKKTNTIKKVDSVKKMLILSDNTRIYLKQIIKIEQID